MDIELANQYIQKADEYLDNEDFENHLKYLLKANDILKDYANVWPLIAKAYYLMED